RVVGRREEREQGLEQTEHGQPRVRRRARHRDFEGRSQYLYTAATSGEGREIGARDPRSAFEVGWRWIPARARSVRSWVGKGRGDVRRFAHATASPDQLSGARVGRKH